LRAAPEGGDPSAGRAASAAVLFHGSVNRLQSPINAATTAITANAEVWTDSGGCRNAEPTM